VSGAAASATRRSLARSDFVRLSKTPEAVASTEPAEHRARTVHLGSQRGECGQCELPNRPGRVRSFRARTVRANALPRGRLLLGLREPVGDCHPSASLEVAGKRLWGGSTPAQEEVDVARVEAAGWQELAGRVYDIPAGCPLSIFASRLHI